MKINLAKFPKDDSVKCKCGDVAEYSFSDLRTLDNPLIVCEKHIPEQWLAASKE